MLNLNTYLLPSLANKLPEKSKERSLAELSIRNLWHMIFDAAPSIVLLSPPNGKEILDPFLIWADRQKLSMNWPLHMHLLNWLGHNSIWQKKLTVAHKKELLIAAAIRWAWAATEDSNALGIMLASPLLEKLGIGAWRSTLANQSPEFSLLQIPAGLFPQHDAYALFHTQKSWSKPEWLTLPK